MDKFLAILEMIAFAILGQTCYLTGDDTDLTLSYICAFFVGAIFQKHILKCGKQ